MLLLFQTFVLLYRLFHYTASPLFSLLCHPRSIIIPLNHIVSEAWPLSGVVDQFDAVRSGRDESTQVTTARHEVQIFDTHTDIHTHTMPTG